MKNKADRKSDKAERKVNSSRSHSFSILDLFYYMPKELFLLILIIIIAAPIIRLYNDSFEVFVVLVSVFLAALIAIIVLIIINKRKKKAAKEEKRRKESIAYDQSRAFAEQYMPAIKQYVNSEGFQNLLKEADEEKNYSEFDSLTNGQLVLCYTLYKKECLRHSAEYVRRLCMLGFKPINAYYLFFIEQSIAKQQLQRLKGANFIFDEYFNLQEPAYSDSEQNIEENFFLLSEIARLHSDALRIMDSKKFRHCPKDVRNEIKRFAAAGLDSFYDNAITDYSIKADCSYRKIKDYLMSDMKIIEIVKYGDDSIKHPYHP